LAAPERGCEPERLPEPEPEPLPELAPMFGHGCLLCGVVFRGGALGEGALVPGVVGVLAAPELVKPVEPLVALGAATAPAIPATALPPSAPATIVAPSSLEIFIMATSFVMDLTPSMLAPVPKATQRRA